MAVQGGHLATRRVICKTRDRCSNGKLANPSRNASAEADKQARPFFLLSSSRGQSTFNFYLSLTLYLPCSYYPFSATLASLGRN